MRVRLRTVSPRIGLLLLAVAALAGAPRDSRAEPDEPPVDSSTPLVTLDALPLGVPLSRLDDDARTRVDAILNTSLLSHRVSGLRSRSREPVFLFLLDHPDFAAAVVRALGLGQYQVERRSEGFWGDDSRGARGMIRVLYQDEGRRLYHLDGVYEGRGLPAIQGRMLVLIEFRHEADAAGTTYLEASVTGHVKLDTPLVGAIAQMASTIARSAVERAADRKVRRFFGTVARVSRWAYEQPDQFWAALESNPDVPQDATLTAFRQILLDGRPPLWASEPFQLLPVEALDAEIDEPEATSP